MQQVMESLKDPELRKHLAAEELKNKLDDHTERKRRQNKFTAAEKRLHREIHNHSYR